MEHPTLGKGVEEPKEHLDAGLRKLKRTVKDLQQGKDSNRKIEAGKVELGYSLAYSYRKIDAGKAELGYSLADSYRKIEAGKAELGYSLTDSYRKIDAGKAVVEDGKDVDINLSSQIEVKKETSAQTCAGTSTQACAACRHQRRKCTSDCPLAPFFPIDDAKKFISAHRIFGVSNILKMLRSLDTMEKKHAAVQCICWEAECREEDPVEGSWGYYKKVCDKILVMKKYILYLTGNPGLGCQSSNNFQVQNTSISLTPPETSVVAAATSHQRIQLPTYSNEASNQANLGMDQISHPISQLQGMLKTGGTSGQACAACKHQRRKCSLDCPLAPFFPPENTQKFISAHRIFGVSNILKMLSSLDTMEKKQTLVQTICWEAECKEEDPAEGSWGYYKRLCEKAQMMERYIQHLRKNRYPSVYQHNNKLQLQDTGICSSVPGSSRAITIASHQIHQTPSYYNKNPNYGSNQENLGMGQMPYPSSVLQGVVDGFNHSAGGDHMLINQGAQGSGIKEERQILGHIS